MTPSPLASIHIRLRVPRVFKSTKLLLKSSLPVSMPPVLSRFSACRAMKWTPPLRHRMCQTEVSNKQSKEGGVKWILPG